MKSPLEICFHRKCLQKQTFKIISILFSIMAVSIYIPRSNAKGFSPLPLQHLFLDDFFDDGHSDWYQLISHCNFDLHFSNNE